MQWYMYWGLEGGMSVRRWAIEKNSCTNTFVAAVTSKKQLTRERSGDGGGGGRGNVRFLRGLSLCYPHTHTHHHTSPSEVGHHRFPPLRSLGTTPPSDVGCLSPLSSPREPCV
eukprot:GHVQ01039431.1.p3 GENE.GHVQ01039431.1~~GHVQ01039431.1.p3  ORF type:complete len:113 (-),score=24.00 GHVQ01039431.1:391-729(-)